MIALGKQRQTSQRHQSVCPEWAENADKTMLTYIGLANIVGVFGWSSGEERWLLQRLLYSGYLTSS